MVPPGVMSLFGRFQSAGGHGTMTQDRLSGSIIRMWMNCVTALLVRFTKTDRYLLETMLASRSGGMPRILCFLFA